MEKLVLCFQSTLLFLSPVLPVSLPFCTISFHFSSTLDFISLIQVHLHCSYATFIQASVLIYSFLL